MTVQLLDLYEWMEFESGSYDEATEHLMSDNGLQRPGHGGTPGHHRKGGVPGQKSPPPRDRPR